MKRKRVEPIIGLLGVFLLISLVVHIFADGARHIMCAQPDLDSSKTGKVISTEINPDIPRLPVPKDILPGHVYVIDNREIIEHNPVVQVDQSLKTASKEVSYGSTVAVKATAASSRLIVVSDNDHIIAIWSNTTGEKRGYYSLRVKEKTPSGHEHHLTPKIVEQYNVLLSEVDWTQCGRVY